MRKQTRRTETSKYPEEKKSTEIPVVAVSETGTALKPVSDQWKRLESRAIVSDSLVHEGTIQVKSSRAEHV